MSFRTLSGTIPDVNQKPNRTEPKTILPLAEAAQVLGIAYDTARKRLHSGSLTGERRGGRWYVHIPKSEVTADIESERVPDVKPEDSGRVPDQTEPIPDARDRLIAALEADVEFLRRQVEEADRRHAAEIERRDVLLREALGRIPQLPSGETRVDRPTTQPEPQGEAELAETSADALRSEMTTPTRRWWEFWKGEWH